MGIYDKLTGKATVGANLKHVQDYFLVDENVITSFQYIRDSIILTNYGIYIVDVQGVTGKKVEVKFFPKKAIKTVSYETSGNFDLDVDIKIGVEGNTVVNQTGGVYSEPRAIWVGRVYVAEE